MNIGIREKFGQMIMLGLDVNEINDEIIEIIKKYKIGGVILYKSLYTDIDSMSSIINKLKKININNIPLFIAIDQENGRVNRLPSEMERIYNPLKQVKTKNIKIIDECNKITSKVLSQLGINMNFAPVVDINYFTNSKAIGDRAYGYNKEDVIKYGLPMVKTLNNNNIISVIKHFPGHGLVDKDSHYLIPKIKNVGKMKDDLVIYEKAIKDGVDGIMVGHLRVKGYENKPASINGKILKELLIDRYNYNGLIITDDLRMNILSKLYGIKNIVTECVKSGVNIMMIKYKNGDMNKLYSELYRMVDNKEIDNELIDKSYNKIIEIKNKYKVTNNIKDNKIDIDNINEQIREVNKKIDSYDIM